MQPVRIDIDPDCALTRPQSTRSGWKRTSISPTYFPRFLLCVRDDQAQAIFELGHRGEPWCDHAVEHLNETALAFTLHPFYSWPQHPDDHRSASAHSQLTANAFRLPNNPAAKSV
jgi:hypothetical protein